ncbi:uncharacterized protein [Nicotiana sylvestris]|uniref:uncharacterized protein n=1 Tax=Nicotiana sylvestris TaxID=4096 RepID=UPI00388CD770
MAKTSKTVPQKEIASSSRPADDGTAAEPHPEEFVRGGCLMGAEFKIKTTSSVPCRCEPALRYICSINDDLFSKVKEDCKWADKHLVVPLPEEAITTHVEGLPKDVSMRPPSSDEDVPLESPAPRQADEKKRKWASSSPNSEKKKPKRRHACKPKGSTGVLSSESINRLRDESEEEEKDKSKLVAHVRPQAKSMVEHARWEAQREALEGVHNQNFNILAAIENAKVEEARSRKLAFPKEDSKSLSKSEGGEHPEDEDTTSDEDQAT